MSALDPTYFLKWVPASDNVFDPSRHATISDEVIYGFRFTHQEAGIPIISVDVENPGISFLAPGRDTWAWISMVEQTTGHVEPIIFARLVQIPTNLVGKVCTVVLSSRADDYTLRKYNLGEMLKVPPHYSGIFVDPSQQDDPDKVLEGYSAEFHVDRLTLEITISDYVVGEDGLLDFPTSDWFWDSLDIQISGTPLVTVRIKGDVQWQQEATGHISINPFTVPESVVKGWPKKGAGIGGGWTVAGSVVVDQNVELDMVTETASYRNYAKVHQPGDVMSWQYSRTHPRRGATGVYLLGTEQVFASIDPYDPDFTDRTNASSKSTYLYTAQDESGRVGMTLRYDMSQGRSETIQFDMTASLQPVFTNLPSINGLPDPTQPQDFETITFSGRDIAQPAGASSSVILYTWTSVKNLLSIGLGMTIRSNDGSSYQRAVQAGHPGTTEPSFGAVAGTIVTDGTMKWASLGAAPQSTFLLRVDGVQVLAGQFWHWVNPVITLGVATTMTFLATSSGITGTSFSPDLTGAPFSDGSVTWVAMGVPSTSSFPLAGGTTNADAAAKTDARMFFPTPRGTDAINYFVEVGRAHILQRARCVQVKFQVPSERFWDLSCRKNAQIHGDRIPGGVALGKIVQYDLTLDGQAGTLVCEITIKCAIGYGNAVVAGTGAPTYVSADYVGPDYQVYAGGETLSSGGDVAVSGVYFNGTLDNGLVLPLTPQQVIVHAGLVPDTDTVAAAVKTLTTVPAEPVAPGSTNAEKYKAKADELLAFLQLNAKKFRMEIKPVTGGPFKQAYFPIATELVVPMQIDLGAQS